MVELTSEGLEPFSDTRVTTFAYDQMNRQRVRTLPLGTATGDGSFREFFVYDNAGRQSRHTTFEGRAIDFVYDDFGRLDRKLFFDENQNPDTDDPTELIDYVYDAYGRQRNIRWDLDPATSETFDRETTNTYDDFGRLTQVDSPEGIINYDYFDNTGQLKRTWTGADSQAPTTATDYNYDRLGRLPTVTATDRNGTDIPDETTEYRYDAVGNLDLVIRPNGVVTDYDYDPLNRLQKQRDFVDTDEDRVFDDGVETQLAYYVYTVEANSRRTQKKRKKVKKGKKGKKGTPTNSTVAGNVERSARVFLSHFASGVPPLSMARAVTKAPDWAQ